MFKDRYGLPWTITIILSLFLIGVPLAIYKGIREKNRYWTNRGPLLFIGWFYAFMVFVFFINIISPSTSNPQADITTPFVVCLLIMISCLSLGFYVRSKGRAQLKQQQAMYTPAVPQAPAPKAPEYVHIVLGGTPDQTQQGQVQKSQVPVSLVCQSCGGVNKAVPGTHAVCQYCESILKN